MKYRRLSRADFAQLGNGKRVHGSLFSAAAHAFPILSATCVVSKDVAPNAADRNRLKRRCREALQKHAQDLPRYALVIRAKKSAASASSEEIDRDLTGLLEKIPGIGYTR